MGTMGTSPLDSVPLQTVVPTNGQTVQIADNADDGLLLLNPASTLATLTVNLPSDAKSRLLQVERIATMRTITLLTVAGATTIYGAPASLAPGDNIAFQKVAANTWTLQI